MKAWSLQREDSSDVCCTVGIAYASRRISISAAYALLHVRLTLELFLSMDGSNIIEASTLGLEDSWRQLVDLIDTRHKTVIQKLEGVLLLADLLIWEFNLRWK